MSSEEDAFLEQIRDSPEDDTVRLVYADWLQEYGDRPQNAELIRTQIELAKLGPEPDSTCCATSQSPRHWCSFRRWWEKNGETARPLQEAEERLAVEWLERWFSDIGVSKHLTQRPWVSDWADGPHPHPVTFDTTRSRQEIRFRRGLPAEAKVPYRWLFGGTCLRCIDHAWWDDCPDCSGKGALDGVIADLFTYPIEWIELSEHAPYVTGDASGHHWYDGGDPDAEIETTQGVRVHPQSDLPSRLYNSLEKPTGNQRAIDGHYMIYPSGAEALRVVSDACIRRGRAEFAKRNPERRKKVGR